MATTDEKAPADDGPTGDGGVGGAGGAAGAEVQPEATDLWCWLAAAFPHRPGGRLDTAVAADALGLSQRTLQRWSADRHIARALSRTQWDTLRRRAILRGRGHPLWPRPDTGTLERERRATDRAVAQVDDLRAGGTLVALGNPDALDPATRARYAAWLDPHIVMCLWQPDAHVWQVAYGRVDSSQLRRTQRGAEIDHEVKVPNQPAAVVLKHLALELVEEHRTLPPRSLVAQGRTATWRNPEGPGVDLADLWGRLSGNTRGTRRRRRS